MPHIIAKGFKILLSIVDKIVVIVSSLALIAGYLSSYIKNDEFTWVFALSFVLPYLYLLNAIIFFLLLVRQRFIWTIAPLIAMVLTFNMTSAIYEIDFFRKYADSDNKSKLKILTYNVHRFRDPSWHFKFDSLINTIDTLNADVICFQEFDTYNVPLDSVKSRFPKLKYVHTHLSDSTDTKLSTTIGTAIFSRYPLINQVNIDFEDSNNRFQYSNIVIDRDTLTLINAHLQSTGLDNSDRIHIENIQNSIEKVNDTTTYKNIVIPIYKKLIEGNRKRRIQSEEVADIVDSSKYPVIVCGDFNSIPSSYTYRILTNRCNLKDSFRELGEGFGSTFNDFNNMLRIDYVLHSNKYKTVKYESPHFKYSDHYPVVVEIVKVID